MTHHDDPQAWLETGAIRRSSDIALGLLLLLIGAFFLGSSIAADTADELPEDLAAVSPWLFPSITAGLLCAVAVFLLLRAWFRRSPPVRSFQSFQIAALLTVFVAFFFALGTWLVTDLDFMLRFGHPEFMALTLLELAVIIALAHSSRLRAAGLVLLGLLLTTIGLDPITGTLRFTMGMEALLKGVDGFVLAAGLLIVGDALVCVISVPLFLRTYTRLITGSDIRRIPTYASAIMRLSAAIALVAAPFFAWALSHTYADIAWIFGFGILGAAAKIFGWNRLALCFGFALGAGLEEHFRSTLRLSEHNHSWLLQEPIVPLLLVAATIVLAVGAVLSFRHTVAPAPEAGMSAE